MTKAEILRNLHQAPPILVLPNAWDVPSARIFERAGFSAIATTSAGIAFALGYPDGERISRAEMLNVVARIARAVKVPVTADLEAGYDSPAETARQAWAAGAVGLNFEDVRGEALVDLEEQMAAICAMRTATPELVINARNDIYLNGIGDEATRFERTVERLNAYRAAGADSLFAPGVRDPSTIARLARAVQGPLNILAQPGSPSVGELEAMGVARVSVGSGPMRATLGLVARIAQELRDYGSYESFTAGAIPYAEVNLLLS
ncbi:MAG: isocitrate lyase/phosphoenolpyruvate mutase family protein [Bryobacteraceae bacterium]|jgi:2-methylisocitrate lyase-like PEP mutase family enzyme